MRLVSAILAGLIFGAGIAISGMINPAKVLNFFDIAGHWDPSLGFVMAGALAVTALGYRLVLARPAPLLAKRFDLPARGAIDARLIAGAVLFGAGWAMAGFCPGGSIPAIGLLRAEPAVFVISMLAGMALARRIAPTAQGAARA
ncbi:MAG: YeeE/YedE family protein [Paracoccus sp. (in: a-proteobacteria)]|nr:YeeE/YedE family protein [Paracoccus sp. (in: a-proteobacteria)]